MGALLPEGAFPAVGLSAGETESGSRTIASVYRRLNQANLFPSRVTLTCLQWRLFMSCSCVLRPKRVLGGEPGPVLRRLLLEALLLFKPRYSARFFSHVAAPFIFALWKRNIPARFVDTSSP